MAKCNIKLPIYNNKISTSCEVDVIIKIKVGKFTSGSSKPVTHDLLRKSQSNCPMRQEAQLFPYVYI